MSSSPSLPDRVALFPFWRPFGALVVDGLKDETRGRPWPFAVPRWIAVYNTEKVARLQPEASLQAAWPYIHPRHRVGEASVNAQIAFDVGEKYAARIGPARAVIGAAYITGSRPLVPEDIGRTFFYAHDRHVWIVAHAVRFARPLALAEVGIKTPPQSFAYAQGAPMRAVLDMKEEN